MLCPAAARVRGAEGSGEAALGSMTRTGGFGGDSAGNLVRVPETTHPLQNLSFPHVPLTSLLLDIFTCIYMRLVLFGLYGECLIKKKLFTERASVNIEKETRKAQPWGLRGGRRAAWGGPRSGGCPSGQLP